MRRSTNPSLANRSLDPKLGFKQHSRRQLNNDELPTLHMPDLPASPDERKPKRLPWDKVNWRTYTRSGNVSMLFWISLVMLTILFFAEDMGSFIVNSTTRILQRTAGVEEEELRIVFDPSVAVQVNHKHVLLTLPLSARGDRDFAELSFRPRKAFADPIPIEDNIDAEQWRKAFLEGMDDGRKDKDDSETCRAVSWYSLSFPTCNQVHEKAIERLQDEGYDVSYLNSGSFRDAFRFQRQNPDDNFVLKRMKFWITMTSRTTTKIHREAIMMERLSHSPRILDIYGYCGTSVFIETMASDLNHKIIIDDDSEGLASQKELDKLDNVYPLNNLTASEKLEISLAMARSLADLHGFEGGPIVHGDTHIEQWLIAPDGSVKLNDFNNAKEPKWNEKEQQYCLTYGSWSDEFYRSPEEYSGEAQDESVDTYALGSNIYTMLTGLWPFYDEQFHGVMDDDNARHKLYDAITDGKRPFIDPRYRTRSFIEGKLVEVMERCWAGDRKMRPSIFEVVSILENIKTETIRRGELHNSTLIKITIP